MDKQRLLIIGNGQAGNNITAEFFNKKYKVAYINSSFDDMRKLPGSDVIKYHMAGVDGFAGDRKKAKEYAEKEAEHFRNHLDLYFPKQDIVYVVFSAGGGTGGGTSPYLVAKLASMEMEKPKEKRRKFGLIIASPADDEDVDYINNAINCFKEINALQEYFANIFIIDNNQGSYQTLNKVFVDGFDRIVNFDIPHEYDTDGRIDNAEIIKLLTVKGYSVFLEWRERSPIKGISTALNTTILVSDIIGSPIKIGYSSFDQNGRYHYEDIKRKFNISEVERTNISFNNDRNFLLLTGLEFPENHIVTLSELLERRSINLKKGKINKADNSIFKTIEIGMDEDDDLEDPREILRRLMEM